MIYRKVDWVKLKSLTTVSDRIYSEDIYMMICMVSSLGYGELIVRETRLFLALGSVR